MAHMDKEEMRGKLKEKLGMKDEGKKEEPADKSEGPAKGEKDMKVSRISIEVLSDGSFLYEVTAKQKESKPGEPCGWNPPDRYAIETTQGVLDAVEDDISTPHMRGSKPPLGSGERFSKLKEKLSAKGASNPSALAAYIGRKRYGKEKFGKLSAKGKKGGGY